MTFDEQGERLVIRQQVPLAYGRLLGFFAIFSVPCVLLVIVAYIMTPVQIAIACDRASNQCTGSPVAAGWEPVTFPLADLSKVHLEQSRGQSVIYLGEGNQGHYQLSDVADSPQAVAVLTSAVEQAHAFAAGSAPEFRVTYPAGRPSVPYYALFATLAFALVWLTQVLKAPRVLEVVADRSRRELTVTRGFVRRTEVKTYGFDTLAKFVARNATASVVFKDSKRAPLVDERTFTATADEAAQLAERLGAFAGVPAERS